MKKATLPENETKRLEALRRYGVLDTQAEKDFDDIVNMAAQICGTPAAMVTLLDEKRMWVKAKKGWTTPEIPRDLSFCSHTILSDNVLTVPDAKADERFKDNPLVTSTTPLLFYAGAPLKTPDGLRIGALCVISNTPKNLDPAQTLMLEFLARQVMNLLELRLALNTKGEFIANISHELRTPLNGVIGVTQMLLDSQLNDDQRQNVETVRNSGQILLNVISDVLDYSKLEAGKMEFKNEAFEIAKITDQAIKMAQPFAQEKGLTLTHKIAADVPSAVMGDPMRFRQLLSNLISNGLKFTDLGGVEVAITCKAGSNEALDLNVSVKDSGTGVASELHTKLFQKFSQVDASTNRRIGGTGLGLAIAKALCENMSGKVWMEKTSPEGSTFTFSLKTRKASQAPTTQVKPLAPGEKATQKLAERHPLRILVAEDNPVNRTVIGNNLAKLGYEADIAINGLYAISLVDAKEYDLILMDCHMPELDGFEATRQIVKKYPKEARPSIYALTASALDEDRQFCFKCGMDGFLTKPISLEDLQTALEGCPIVKYTPGRVAS